MILLGWPLVSYNPILNFSIEMMKIHKPKRILLACDWITYFNKNKLGLDEPDYDYKLIDEFLEGFFTYIKKIQELNLGIEINVLALEMHHRNYHPLLMSDADGIIE